MINRKTMSSIVATSLLLVVAVVAVVGFQIWSEKFSSNLFLDVERQTYTLTQIENVFSGVLYFKNGVETLEITEMKINNNNCYVYGVYSYGLKSIPISNCTMEGENNIIVYTNKGVYEKTIYKEYNDYTNPCPQGYIVVQGNSNLNTSNFCVMKFEAKNVANIPVSQAALVPWTDINQTNARANCSNLGINYHLITNAEWTTIARSTEIVSINWNSSIVGTGFMFSGHNDNGQGRLSVTNISDYYDQTGDSNISCDGAYQNYVSSEDNIFGRACLGQKRVLMLNNSEIIWDLGGNSWEWTNDTCDSSLWYGTGYIEWNNVNLADIEKSLAGPIGSYTNLNGVGRYVGCTNNQNSFIRGGASYDGPAAGAFGLGLNYNSSTHSGGGSFRCVYNEE